MEPKKPKFDIGEKCICYVNANRIIVEILGVYNSGGYCVRSGFKDPYPCHEKQLRKLVKKKRRGWWMLPKREAKVMATGEAMNAYISTTKPYDTTGWIYVEEKRVK